MSKEIQEIIGAVEALAAGERAILATVVDLEGSGYRLPGARMLIRADGRAFGTISGGCLESDVIERARKVLRVGQAELFTYDTTDEEESVFNLNMGCRGVLRLLFEPVDAESPIIGAFRATAARRCRIKAATVIETRDDGGVSIGTRFMTDESSGEIFGKSDASTLSAMMPLRYDLMAFSGKPRQFQVVDRQLGESVMQMLFEVICPPVRLIILGAGADAVPLADTARSIGWQVEVYDHRPAFLNADRFPNASVHLTARDTAPPIEADDLTAIVTMNHNYDRDRNVLAAAIRSNAFYVGVLGPKRRTEQMLDEIGRNGEALTSEDLINMRSPAGLDIGGDSPETIAISIIAEIQSVLKKRSGMPLQLRGAPIYDRK